MKSLRRFLGWALAGLVLVLGSGLWSVGHPLWAQESPPPASPPVVKRGEATRLEPEPATWSDRTLTEPPTSPPLAGQPAAEAGENAPPEELLTPADPGGEASDPPLSEAEQPSNPDPLSTLEQPFPATPDAENMREDGPWVDRDELGQPSDVEIVLRGMDPEAAARSRLLMEADRLYVAGDRTAATALYRQAKDPDWVAEASPEEPLIPLMNPEELPPGGRVYWREAQAGLESEFPNRVLVPLGLLVKEYPEFLPAQLLYARYLLTQDRAAEAAASLEESALRYPYHPEVLKAQVEVQMAQERWIEAAITANQFAILNPDHPEAEAMGQLATRNLDRFRGDMNQTLTRNLVGNIITGAAGYFLTGGLFGPFTAINSGILLMQGEQGLGQQAADQVMRQLPIVEDPDIRAYVNDMGQRLAALAGRTEFDYRFEVIMDDSLNAFALPGGKIFINAGAITRSRSEAELAGLLGHEIAHAVLSHGFQLVTQGNLTASLASFIPVPEVASIAANLIVAGYSRDMERQADILGTKLLATERYAADGLHNLMATLEQEYGNRGVTWFASHPNPRDRIGYLKQLVDQGGLNRYTYEGVEPHLQIRHKMTQLLNAYKLEQAEAEENRTPPAP